MYTIIINYTTNYVSETEVNTGISLRKFYQIAACLSLSHFYFVNSSRVGAEPSFYLPKDQFNDILVPRGSSSLQMAGLLQ